MDVFLPKFGNLESDAEQSHWSWHVFCGPIQVRGAVVVVVPDGFGEVCEWVSSLGTSCGF